MTRPPVDDPSISREDPLHDLLRVAAAVAVVGIHALAASATAELFVLGASRLVVAGMRRVPVLRRLI